MTRSCQSCSYGDHKWPGLPSQPRDSPQGPGNGDILISNQHYISLSTDSEEFEQMYRERPIACKLTDFGESQSL